MRTPIVAALAGAGLVAACVSPTPGILETTLPQATPQSFTYCSGYGCSIRWDMVITPEEWAVVHTYFNDPAPSPAAEREQMALAVGYIEKVTGRKAQTDGDKPGAAILTAKTRGQLDCIDESHNTTLYLTFMQRDGLFKHHNVGEPAHRGMIIDRWFHNTATVVEKATGEVYVIDSWFGANGEPADIVDLATWLDGWSPEKFSTRTDR